MGELIFYGFWFVILYGIAIWTFLNPEESLIIFRRWEYKEEPVFSDLAVTVQKYGALFVVLFLTLIAIHFTVDKPFVSLILALGLAVYGAFAVVKVLSEI